MKKIIYTILVLLSFFEVYAQTGNQPYFTSVYFPPNYQIGDYVEFVKVDPIDAGASGNYEISISYTRGNIAAAATHLAAIVHSGPNLWRETGRINHNGYVNAELFNFTVDCNTQYTNARFRVRAVNTFGVHTDGITVNIKVTPINFNNSWSNLNVTGNDISVNKMQPMTNDWSLYVGNTFTSDGAKLALKADVNGNVGIGINNPDAKLSVNGNIHAKEVKVDLSFPAPDYVFKEDYKLTPLSDIQSYIKINKHLPEIPSAKEMEKNGINLSEMNMLLLKKVEELTLHLIEQNKLIQKQNDRINKLEAK